jgi:hypothetical protein
MVVTGSHDGSPITLRCDHCSRAVCETQHTRASYRVDYYSLHTGEVEESTVAHESGSTFTYQKLVSVVHMITCADCYRKPSVQREREARFRPERVMGASD